MKDSFALPDARTVMIATVSPASKDTEHSLSTLRHACLMIAKDSANGKESGSEAENDDGAAVSSSENSNKGNNKRVVSNSRNSATGAKSSMSRGENRPGIYTCVHTCVYIYMWLQILFFCL